MPSQVLSSNFDLLNLGATTRSLFGRRRPKEETVQQQHLDHSSSSRTAQSSSSRSGRRILGNDSTRSGSRRQATAATGNRGLARQSTRVDEYFEPTPSSSKQQAMPSSQRQLAEFGIGPVETWAASSSSASTTAAAGSKRKRPGVAKSRAASGSSTRSISTRRSKEAPSELILDDSSQAVRLGASRRNESSLSLRQGLDRLAIESPESSPTRARNNGASRRAPRMKQSASASSNEGRRAKSMSVESSLSGSIGSNGSLYSSNGDDDDDDDHGESAQADEDYQLLKYGSAYQLDRLRKDRLKALTEQASIDSSKMDRAEMINAIVEYGNRLRNRGPPSSNTRRASRSQINNKPRSSAAPGQPLSDRSADYEDASDEDDGHEGGGEETEAETSTSRIHPRKGRKLAPSTSNMTIGPKKPARIVKGLRASFAPSPTKAGSSSNGDTTLMQSVASPMVNRLRSQRSIQFTASSPHRPGRIKGRGVNMRRQTLPADGSPNKSSFIQPRRVRQPRKAKAEARRKILGDDVEDDEMVGISEEEVIEEDQEIDVEAEEADEDAQSHLATEDEAEAANADVDDEDGEDDGDATPTEDVASDADSDLTDVPDGILERANPTSSASPTKIRRLRNGKLRIIPIAEVQDTDLEVDSQLTSLPRSRRDERAGQSSSSGKVKTARPANRKPATPQLSASNAEAQLAEGDAVDELNGLDLESLNLTDKEIPCRQLTKVSKIGSGGFKDVFVGIWKTGKRKNKVAIADIREKLTEMDIKELGLLRDLKHENIVRFIGVSIPDDTLKTGIPCMIVSELCSNGDLWDYVRNVKPPRDLDIFKMLLETARGLEYLHMHSIVHRDVKSSNVLVTKDRSCKINDFGLARVKKSQRSKMKSVVGTVNWQAVELWCKQPQYNEKVDVWSAAMTFWETLQWYEDYKSYPFEGMNEFTIYEEVGKDGLRPPTEKISQQFGDDIVKLLNRMWEADPRKRPTMDTVCKDLEKLIELRAMEMDQ